MPSFGEKLKLEREKRAITLEQISLSTKIGTRMLQALEEENFDQLPGGIFNRGFVRAYARHVGLDEDQAIADYLVASGEGPLQKPELELEAMADQVEVRQATHSRQIPWGLFATILLVLALALFWWSRRHKHEGQSVPSPAASTTAQKMATDPAAGSQTSSATGARRAAPPALVKSEVDAAPTPALAAAPAGKVLVAPKVTAEVSAPAPGEFTVVILAREDSWLSITADGKIILAETLVEGNQRAVHARKEVVVRAGNVGGLDFVFNRKKLASKGDYGEVKTLTFGVAGLQPNSPAAPAEQ